MAPDSQAELGVELVERDPNDGENSAWVAGEIYQSATPAQWDNVPIAFFRRQGNNKLIVGNDLYSSSVLKELGPVESPVTDGTSYMVHFANPFSRLVACPHCAALRFKVGRWQHL